MSSRLLQLNPDKIVMVFPVRKEANETIVKLRNVERRFSRASSVGATILFQTKTAAYQAFEALRFTEMNSFGSSWGKDASCRTNEFFVDIHGNTNEILEGIQRVFNVTLKTI